MEGLLSLRIYGGCLVEAFGHLCKYLFGSGGSLRTGFPEIFFFYFISIIPPQRMKCYTK